MDNVNMRVTRNLNTNNGVTFDCYLLFVFQEIKHIFSINTLFITQAKVFSAFNHISELGCAWLVKRDFVHQKHFVHHFCSLWWKKKNCFMFLDLPQVVLLQSEYLILRQARITLNWTETPHSIVGLHFVHYGYSLTSFVSVFHPTGFNTFRSCNLHTVCRHSKPKQSHVLQCVMSKN